MKRTSSTANPTLLWVDLNVSVKDGELPGLFSQYFEVRRPHAGSTLEAEIGRQDPDAIIFDFDFPERPGLKLMEITKKQFASIPMVMMTTQHSEAMAVWAFRSQIWDYLVKPVSERDLRRCLSALKELVASRPSKRSSRSIHSKASPVPEENRVSTRTTTPAELMPALSYVEQHFRDNVTSAVAAQICSMDNFRFSRVFKSTFGIGFKEYLLRVRIKEACRLLDKPDIAVTEVAYLCGFNDPSYFTKVFKRFAGVAPSAYANSNERHILLDGDILDAAHDN